MKITVKWLGEHKACLEGTEWFFKQKETKAVKVLEALIKAGKLDWANWLICRLMGKTNCVRYAIFAAEQALSIFEKKYPNDDRPRKAIEAAKAWIENPNDETKHAADAAYATADAANAAAYAPNAAADAAYATADAAADAAYATANAAPNAAAAYATADATADAAYATADATADAAYATADAAYAAADAAYATAYAPNAAYAAAYAAYAPNAAYDYTTKKKLHLKILKYGIRLLKGENNDTKHS